MANLIKAVSVFHFVYEQAEQADSKIGSRVFNALDTESISDIILDGDTFWFEHNQVHDYVTSDVYNWIIKLLERKGYKYLYN